MSILAKLRVNQKKRARLGKQQEAADLELQKLVREAFDSGMKGPAIAEAADLSVPRIYQVRDGRR